MGEASLDEFKVTVTLDSRQNKAIGLVTAFCLTFTMLTGCGIFISVSPTFDVYISDSIGMVVVFWIFGGIVTLFGGLCYAELGTRIPESGGERAYYSMVLNAKVARIYVIFYTLIGRSITLAAVGVIAGSYFANVFWSTHPNYEVAVKVVAFITILICFILNVTSKEIVNKISIPVTVVKIIGLLIVIGCGIYYMSTHKLPEWKQPFNVTGFQFDKFFLCITNVVFSYDGWNTIGMVVGDMKNPVRDLPLALISAIIIVVLMNVIIVVSYAGILGFAAVRTTQTVASDVGKQLLKGAYPILPLLIFISASGTADSILYSGSSVLMSAGYNGELPRIFSLVQYKKRTAIPALIVQLAVASIFLTFKFQVLLNFFAFLSWLFYFLSITCLLKIKMLSKEEPQTKIFKIPMAAIFPIQIICVFIIFVCFYLGPVGCSVFTILIVGVYACHYIPQNLVRASVFEQIHDNLCMFLIQKFGLVFADKSDIS
ncbi:b(0,+)-type amino acid transporter 1 [Thelohanellus kitauei]|uniref:B(0,+)-type amino acid transporter 1 n=1 Tax=Thelohanellus kitauei TaxID=669202 RepID=A0A0C2MEK6_THEKT|nr:b(0,+)-type amino acid transporter 1 [Thelohanellus kitauei]